MSETLKRTIHVEWLVLRIYLQSGPFCAVIFTFYSYFHLPQSFTLAAVIATFAKVKDNVKDKVKEKLKDKGNFRVSFIMCFKVSFKLVFTGFLSHENELFPTHKKSIFQKEKKNKKKS